MVPLLLKVNPAGSDPSTSSHIIGGVPSAVSNVVEYGSPTTPGGRFSVVIIKSKVNVASKTPAPVMVKTWKGSDGSR